MIIQFHTMLVAIIVLLGAFELSATEISDAMIEEFKNNVDTPFSTEKGQAVWESESPKGRSCTTCHTDSVLVKGRHERTGKIIQPMAPSINPERLTKRKKIKKWFLRNCKWTLGRECTDEEKGHILLWLSQQ